MSLDDLKIKKKVVWNQYYTALNAAINIMNNFEPNKKIDELINNWKLTYKEIFNLKKLWFTEDQIIENFDELHLVNNLIEWKAIPYSDLKLLVECAKNLKILKWYLKQIIDLNKLSIDKRNIIKQFLNK
jgi:hypothetical protein